MFDNLADGPLSDDMVKRVKPISLRSLDAKWKRSPLLSQDVAQSGIKGRTLSTPFVRASRVACHDDLVGLT